MISTLLSNIILLCLTPDYFTCQRLWEHWCSMANQTIYTCVLLTHLIALHPNAPYFTILLCLTPDDFTHQGLNQF
jgi:hypothetical protein